MNKNIIEIKDLDFIYPDGTHALRKLSMSIERGKKIAIIGPNGSGKTTLFLNLNGVYKPSGGSIYFSGKKVSYSKKELIQLKREIGIVFQDSNAQLFSANVFQEVSFGPLNLGMSKEEVRQRVEEALVKVNITGLKSKPTHFLSGGQKKRVAIADVLAMDPSVILLDEPTAFVDPKTGKELMEFFDVLNKAGKTIVLSTHDMNKVYGWADYVFVIQKGSIIGEGIPEDVFRNEYILREADLEKPWILELYEEIIKDKSSFATEKIPKTKDEILKWIKEKI